MAAPKGNKYALGNNGGRPRKFESAADVYEQGTIYINGCLESGKHLTFTGLCLALGLGKDTFNDYASGKYDNSEEVFSFPLKELKQRIEQYAENKLFANNPTGAIFALKNYGWKDKSETELTGPGGGPIQAVSLNNLSLEELEGLERLALKASSND